MFKLLKEKVSTSQDFKDGASYIYCTVFSVFLKVDAALRFIHIDH